VSQVLAVEIVLIAVLALLLWGTAAVAAAARTLNRVQRRAWASGGGEERPRRAKRTP